MDAASAVPDRYALVSPLGHGAMGTVWRARDRELQRDVAVKVLALAGPGAPGSASRFQREAQAAATIDDPHVVRVLDAGHADRTAWLVMELLPGPSLADLVAEGPLPWERGIALAVGIAQGIAAAHAAGVVHRDIKPGNVVLRGEDAVIVDFGIARLTEGDATRTTTGVLAGTAAYLAPEQARGEVVTPATDLYSFGCLLMTMFTGASPFSGEHAVAQAYAHVNTPAPRLSDRRPDAPAALDDLVARLLAKDPSRRPIAPAVVAELARLRDDPDATSGLPPPPDQEPTAPLTRLDAMLQEQSAALPPRAAAPWRRALPILAMVAALAAIVGSLLPPERTPQPQPPGSPAATPQDTAATTASGAADPSRTPTAGSAPGSAAAPPSVAPAPSQAPTTAQAPTSAPATTASGPATTRPTATVPAQVLAGVRDAIQDVANPGARGQLQRAWTQASDGITADNADARMATFTATLGTMPQVTDAERAALVAALDRVRAA